MVVWFVVLYLAVSLGLGLIAATRVHNSRDYALAGRSLPVYVIIAMVFATWFGSETVLGISSEFMDGNLGSIVADPFGAGLCLILVGLFFARKLYRMNLLTIGDYYRQRYNRPVELAMSIAIVVSYLGWVSAQIIALGLVFDVLSEGAISLEWGMVIGAAVVMVYTIFGGMWSVAVTTFMQMIVIVLGLLFIAWYVAGLVPGGAAAVIEHASANNKFEFWPAFELRDVLAFIALAITMMLGSIPQQDVFQRVMSAKTENAAARGTIIGGAFYILFAFVPIFLAYSALLIDPEMVAAVGAKDSQHILPRLVMDHTPVFVQIVFFGALLSTIMSTASGTLLAPSVTFTENVLKPWIKNMNDRQFLWTMRGVVAGFTLVVLWFALKSEGSIYAMVEEAYTVTLVAAFVPLVAGLYWKRATTQGAVFAIALGVATWLITATYFADGIVPPNLFGVLMSALGMAVGSLLPSLAPVSSAAADEA